jgi:hypothetical protein
MQAREKVMYKGEDSLVEHSYKETAFREVEPNSKEEQVFNAICKIGKGE